MRFAKWIAILNSAPGPLPRRESGPSFQHSPLARPWPEWLIGIRDEAPMRISFTHIPDAGLEGD